MFTAMDLVIITIFRFRHRLGAKVMLRRRPVNSFFPRKVAWLHIVIAALMISATAESQMPDISQAVREHRFRDARLIVLPLWQENPRTADMLLKQIGRQETR